MGTIYYVDNEEEEDETRTEDRSIERRPGERGSFGYMRKW